MRIKKFQGRNMRESLEKMRQELGDEAVILSSRELNSDNGLTMMEVVAGIEPEELAQYREQQARVPQSISMAAGERLPSPRNIPYIGDAAPVQKAQFVRAQKNNLTENTQPNLLGLQAEIEQLKKSIQSLIESNGFHQSSALPPIYRQLHQKLRKSGFRDDRAMNLVGRLSSMGLHNDYDSLFQECRTTIGAKVTTVSPIRVGGDPKVILVFGPAGSGKSSVCSKLANSFALTVNASALILSQSQSLLDARSTSTNVKHENYFDATALAERMGSEHDFDFVFVEVSVDNNALNTASDLAKYREITNADCSLLTLQTGLNEQCIERWLKLCAATKDASLVVTQTDLNTLDGDFISSIQQNDVRISYFTDGKTAPQFIKAATPERIVDLVLPINENQTGTSSGTSIERS